MAEPRFMQLLPLGGDSVTASEVIRYEPLAALAPPDRPYVAVNFVASFDGRVTVQGSSRALGDDGDRAIFHALREQADAILAGTGTMRAESYGRMLGRAVRRERRAQAGRPPEPLAVLLSRSGEIPFEIPLFGEPEARVVLFTPAELHPPAEVRAELIHHPTADPAEALGILRREHGVRSLLCEGGAQLFGALLDAGLVDELFLTLDPKLVGGAGGPGILAGVSEAERALRITSLLEREHSLFARLTIAG